jgi:transposase InsO family protein
MVRNYNSEGLSVERCLELVGLTPNQYYHKSSGKPVGRRPSTTTDHKSPYTSELTQVDNVDVLSRIVEIKLDPDHANYYRLITITLCLQGYIINHKKVYRLMYEHLLLEDRKSVKGKNYVKYRRVAPQGALQLLEMDIKYVYIHEKGRYAFVLTVIDTYTRYVLHWAAGYSMRTMQVQEVWEYILAHYIQPIRGKSAEVEIEVRSDNGKQFSSKQIMNFFEENELTKVFTHPYTPEENGHIESFHSKLGKALKHDRFADLQALEKRLTHFYTMYNNKRSHGSLKGLPPAIFWALEDLGYVSVTTNHEKRTNKIELNVAYQDILGIPKVNKYKYRALRA